MRSRASIVVTFVLSVAARSLSGQEAPEYMLWGTYLGGLGFDEALAIGADVEGNVFVGGFTESFDFLDSAGFDPIENQGGRDAVIVKLAADGSEVLESFSIGGPGADAIFDLKVTSAGDVFVLGDLDAGFVPEEETCRSGVAGSRDVFVARLNNDLELQALQLIGGSGDDVGTDLDVTDDGVASILGNTTSRNLDTTPGAFQESSPNFGASVTDYLVARVDLSPERDCSERVLYLTYLGSGANEDTPGHHTNAGLVADDTGLVTIAGLTRGGLLFPRTANAYRSANLGHDDIVVTQLQCDATLPKAQQLHYSTVLGGSRQEKPKWVGVTEEGTIQVVGWTWSGNFPTTEPVFHHGQNDIFVTEINPSAFPEEAQLHISEFIGASSYDPPGDCVARPDGSILIGGITGGGNFPTTEDALGPIDGANQAYLVEWSRDLEARPADRLRYGTALSSGAFCEWSACDRVWDVAVAPDGTVLVCGVVSGLLFGDTADTVQPASAGGADMFVMRLDLRHPGQARFTADPLEGPAPLEVCFDAAGAETADGTVIDHYRWDFGDGESMETDEAAICHTYTDPGIYDSDLSVFNDLGLSAAALEATRITVACPAGETLPWEATDVGSVKLPGGSSWLDDGDQPCLSICATGKSLAGSTDAFHFLHQTVSAEVDHCLAATIVDLEAERTTAAVGLMFRESTADDGRAAAVVLRNSSSRELRLYYRDAPGGRLISLRPGLAVDQLPVRVRLEHRRTEISPTGVVDEFVGYAQMGDDESGWAEVGRVEMEEAITGDDTFLAGIAATSGTIAETFRALQARVCDPRLDKGPCDPPQEPRFRRGDDNGDGAVDVSDPVNSLSVQFLGEGFAGCVDAMDFNDDGRYDVSDPIANLSHQFLGTDPPAAPGKDDCGPDPTPDDRDGNGIPGEDGDELGCEVYPAPSDPVVAARQCD